MIDVVTTFDMSRFQVMQKDAPTVGIQSRIDRGMFDGMPAIRKTCGETLLPIQRQILLEAIPVYRDQLKSAGVSVPMNYQAVEVDGSIVVVDQLIFGDDIDAMIRTGNPRAIGAWENMALKLCELHEGGNKSRAMLDAKPANFVLDQDDKLWYVDTFPPAVRSDNGDISPYISTLYRRPRELFTFNYGDTRGQFTKLLAGTKLSYPDQFQTYQDLTMRVVSESHLPDSTKRFVENEVANDFPTMKALYSDNVGVLLTI